MLRAAKAFVVVGIVFAGGLLGGSAVATSAADKGANPYAGLDTFARALTTIESHHVDPVDSPDLVYDAVQGMVSDLDPHSLFLDPGAYAQLQARTEGRFFGVGVEITNAPRGGVVIVRVVRDGPADLAGVESGDIIMTVDGHDVSHADVDTLGDLLTGARDTPVRLVVLRDRQRLDITVVRDKVIEIAVDGELFEPGWAYVRIDHFRRRVTDELHKLLVDLEAEGDRPLEGVVLDLRGNPGGLLEEAIGVIDLFVGSGLIVETLGRDGLRLESHDASSDPGDLDADLVILVDAGSASAAEIVAGALQAMGRARLVGERTYGKGSVQQVYEFEDGSALKLTVARYVLPGDRQIEDRVGIEPDIVVVPDTSDAAEALREQVAGLDIDATDRAQLLDAIDALVSSVDSEAPAFPRTGPLSARLTTDDQLEAAWRAIRQAD